jgi:hypothetical protein
MKPQGGGGAAAASGTTTIGFGNGGGSGGGAATAPASAGVTTVGFGESSSSNSGAGGAGVTTIGFGGSSGGGAAATFDPTFGFGKPKGPVVESETIGFGSASTAPKRDGPAVRCAFSDRNLHSRMLLDPTHVINGIPLGSALPLTGLHCKFRPNTEGNRDGRIFLDEETEDFKVTQTQTDHGVWGSSWFLHNEGVPVVGSGRTVAESCARKSGFPSMPSHTNDPIRLVLHPL